MVLNVCSQKTRVGSHGWVRACLRRRQFGLRRPLHIRCPFRGVSLRLVRWRLWQDHVKTLKHGRLVSVCLAPWRSVCLQPLRNNQSIALSLFEGFLRFCRYFFGELQRLCMHAQSPQGRHFFLSMCEVIWKPLCFMKIGLG